MIPTQSQSHHEKKRKRDEEESVENQNRNRSINDQHINNYNINNNINNQNQNPNEIHPLLQEEKMNIDPNTQIYHTSENSSSNSSSTVPNSSSSNVYRGSNPPSIITSTSVLIFNSQSSPSSSPANLELLKPNTAPGIPAALSMDSEEDSDYDADYQRDDHEDEEDEDEESPSESDSEFDDEVDVNDLPWLKDMLEAKRNRNAENSRRENEGLPILPPLLQPRSAFPLNQPAQILTPHLAPTTPPLMPSSVSALPPAEHSITIAHSNAPIGALTTEVVPVLSLPAVTATTESGDAEKSALTNVTSSSSSSITRTAHEEKHPAPTHAKPARRSSPVEEDEADFDLGLDDDEEDLDELRKKLDEMDAQEAQIREQQGAPVSDAASYDADEAAEESEGESDFSGEESLAESDSDDEAFYSATAESIISHYPMRTSRVGDHFQAVIPLILSDFEKEMDVKTAMIETREGLLVQVLYDHSFQTDFFKRVQELKKSQKALQSRPSPGVNAPGGEQKEKEKELNDAAASLSSLSASSPGATSATSLSLLTMFADGRVPPPPPPLTPPGADRVSEPGSLHISSGLMPTSSELQHFGPSDIQSSSSTSVSIANSRYERLLRRKAKKQRRRAERIGRTRALMALGDMGLAMIMEEERLRQERKELKRLRKTKTRDGETREARHRRHKEEKQERRERRKMETAIAAAAVLHANLDAPVPAAVLSGQHTPQEPEISYKLNSNINNNNAQNTSLARNQNHQTNNPQSLQKRNPVSPPVDLRALYPMPIPPPPTADDLTMLAELPPVVPHAENGFIIHIPPNPNEAHILAPDADNVVEEDERLLDQKKVDGIYTWQAPPAPFGLPPSKLCRPLPELSATLRKKKLKAVIIGAGLAGLACANELKAMGINVMLIEARDRVGGRIFTDTNTTWQPMFPPESYSSANNIPYLTFPPLSIPIESGASYIYGGANNPLTGVAQSLGLSLLNVPQYLDEKPDVKYELSQVTDKFHNTSISTDSAASVLYKSNGAIHDKRVEYIESQFLNTITSIKIPSREQLDELSISPNPKDSNVSSFLDRMRQVLPPEDRAIWDWNDRNLEYYMCASNKANSAQSVAMHYSNAFVGDTLCIRDGMSALCTALAKGMKIESGIVESIEHDDWKVKISCTGQKEFFADFAIVTVPLGVLKSNSIKFSPPLPKWKQEAINRVGFGTVNKVILQFDQVFWPESDAHIGICPESNNESMFTTFLNQKPLTGRPILTGIVASQFAKTMEQLEDLEITTQAMTCLRRLFPTIAVPNPIRTFVTRWNLDPFARGTGSFIPTGQSPYLNRLLAQPIPSSPLFRNSPPSFLPASLSPTTTRVFFAGEHTSVQFANTAHGAWMSGIREAHRLLDIICKRVFFGAECDDEDEEDEVAMANHTSKAYMFAPPFCILCYKLYPPDTTPPEKLAQLGPLRTFYDYDNVYPYHVHHHCIAHAPEVLHVDNRFVHEEEKTKLKLKYLWKREDEEAKSQPNAEVVTINANAINTSLNSRTTLPMRVEEDDREADQDEDDDFDIDDEALLEETDPKVLFAGSATPTYRWFNVTSCVRRSVHQVCANCGYPGAVIGCHDPQCLASYHYPCAIQAGWDFNRDDMGDWFYCPSHIPGHLVPTPVHYPPLTTPALPYPFAQPSILPLEASAAQEMFNIAYANYNEAALSPEEYAEFVSNMAEAQSTAVYSQMLHEAQLQNPRLGHGTNEGGDYDPSTLIQNRASMIPNVSDNSFHSAMGNELSNSSSALGAMAPADPANGALMDISNAPYGADTASNDMSFYPYYSPYPFVPACDDYTWHTFPLSVQQSYWQQIQWMHMQVCFTPTHNASIPDRGLLQTGNPNMYTTPHPQPSH